MNNIYYANLFAIMAQIDSNTKKLEQIRKDNFLDPHFTQLGKAIIELKMAHSSLAKSYDHLKQEN